MVIAISAAMALAWGSIHPQAAREDPAVPAVVIAPFASFGERTEVTVDFWCRFDPAGVRQCDAQARDGFDLPPDAGDWLELRTGSRADLAETGLEQRVSLTFKPDAERPSVVRDAERYWRFWWPELREPVWSVAVEDLPRHLFYLPVSPEERSTLVGKASLLCGVRTDGHLGLCIPAELAHNEAGARLAMRARAVAANLRLEPTTADGQPTSRHYVRIDMDYDGAAGLPIDPVFYNPEVLAVPTREEMSAMYPARALQAAVTGQAEVECVAPAEIGPLENCTVMSETPGGWGFGAQSVIAAEKVITSPFRVDGRPFRQVVKQRFQWSL